MIDPKDLRIGNLVSCEQIGDTYTDRKPYYGEYIYEVTGLRGGFVWLDIGHDEEEQTMIVFCEKVPCEHVQPIPLAEYWLKMAGFVDRELTAGPNVFVWHEGGVYIRGMSGAVHPKEVKYLHQLQNLYFALTGDELQFKTQQT